jgi:hypothetical protein
MSLLILALVNGVPFSNLNKGASFFLGFSLNHVVKAFTGQIGPSNAIAGLFCEVMANTWV